MLMERLQHLLLLLVVVAAVQVLRLVLLVKVLCFHTFVGLLPVQLHLHVGQVRRLVIVEGRVGEAVLQILAHSHHPDVVARWRVDG